jgi:hypothetical protein
MLRRNALRGSHKEPTGRLVSFLELRGRLVRLSGVFFLLALLTCDC